MGDITVDGNTVGDVAVDSNSEGDVITINRSLEPFEVLTNVLCLMVRDNNAEPEIKYLLFMTVQSCFDHKSLSVISYIC